MPVSNDVRSLIEASKDEAATLVRLVADPPIRGDTVKIRIRRAASRLGWTFSRTQDIWRKEARRIDAFEMDQLRRFNGAAPEAKSGTAVGSNVPFSESGGKHNRKKQS